MRAVDKHGAKVAEGDHALYAPEGIFDHTVDPRRDSCLGAAKVRVGGVEAGELLLDRRHDPPLLGERRNSDGPRLEHSLADVFLGCAFARGTEIQPLPAKKPEEKARLDGTVRHHERDRLVGCHRPTRDAKFSD